MTDADLQAEIDRTGGQLASLILLVRDHIEARHGSVGARPVVDADYRLIAADPDRWVDIASDQLQLGLMALRRAVTPSPRF